MTEQPPRRKHPRRWLAHVALAVPLLTLAASPAAIADDCDVRGTVERPAEDAVVTNQPVIISGWAADIGAESGTGINEVRVALDADPDQGGVPVPALYGWQRPDVADLLSAPRFAASGLALSWDATGVAPGRHTLYIQARSACGWITVTRTVLVAGQQSTTTAPASPTPARGATTPGGATPSTGPTAPGTGPTAPGVAPGTGPTVPGATPAIRPTVPTGGQTAPGTVPGGVTGPTAPGGVTGPTAPGGVTTSPGLPGVTVPGATAPGAIPGGVATLVPTPGIPLAPRTQ